jgi:hypothetical protein
MPTINQLPLRSPVSLGDQIPIYSPNNGDARRTPVSAVVDLVVNGLDLPNTAVLLTGDQTVGGTKTFSNAIVGSITGNAGTVTNGVYTTGNQTIGGTKTFSSAIVGDITGNAGTVTNGVYTTGNQTIGGTKTFSSTIVGDISGNAGSVTNGVYTTGNQTIGGTKTFSSAIVGDITGNAATATTATTATTASSVTNGVYTVGDQTIGGTKTFSVNPILSAGTVNAILTLDGSKQISAVSGLTWNSVTSNLSLNGITVGRGGGDNTNAVLGWQALPTTSAADYNVAIGFQAMFSANASAENNTAIGSEALRGNTSGQANVGVGVNALESNQTGDQNVAVGASALQANTVTGNVAVGANALTKNTTGTFNTAIGTAALQDPITGSNNTAIGDRALEQFGGASSSNTAVGCNALRGSFVLGSNASNNTAVGHNAGRFITTGGFNTILGSFDGNQNSLDIRTTSNNIVLSDGVGNPRCYYDGPNNAWIWRTGASERLRLDSSGNVAFSAGTAAAPALTTTGDTDTGVFFPAANTWSVATGAFERMRISSAGNVGIGTTSPNFPLHVAAAGNNRLVVESTTSGAALIGLYAPTGALAAFNQIQSIVGATEHWAIGGNGWENTLTFRTAGSERMRIASGGNVGIGTTNPQATLHVAGTILSASPFGNLATLQAVGGTGFRWTLNNDGTYRLQRTTDGFASVAATPMLFDASGNVGIGMTPGTKLDVQGDITARGASISSTAYINMGAAYTAAYLEWVPGSSQLTIMNSQAGPLRFATNNGERMRITSGGRVGIGTTDPGYALTVANGDIGVKRSATNDGAIFFGSNTDNYIYGGNASNILTLATNNSERMRITSGGDVGIGTNNPAVKLEVAGQIRTEAPTGGTAANWRLGTVHTVSPTSPNRTIEVDIGGTIYYLHAKTTNN